MFCHKACYVLVNLQRYERGCFCLANSSLVYSCGPCDSSGVTCRELKFGAQLAAIPKHEHGGDYIVEVCSTTDTLWLFTVVFSS